MPILSNGTHTALGRGRDQEGGRMDVQMTNGKLTTIQATVRLLAV